MNKQEFEQRYGKKVEDTFFRQAERIYMAAGDELDKDEFCKKFKTVGGNADALELMLDLTDQVTSYKSLNQANVALNKSYSTQLEACDARRRELDREVRELDRKLKDNMAENAAALVAMVVKGKMYKEAAEIFGRKRVISVKLTAGIELDAEDQQFIIEKFREQD